MITVTRYTPSDNREWDAMVEESKNGSFLFLRAYMDYHSDRFTDHSLLYRNGKGRLVALMPANEDGDTLWSHQGLTYGGIVMARGIHAREIGEIFDVTRDYLKEQGFTQWVYKQMPTIYSTLPAQEDEYWLWRNGAELAVCNLASVVDYTAEKPLDAEYCRRNALTKLVREGVRPNMCADIATYWTLLADRLKEKYGASPVHELSEMSMLMERFPDRILCCAAETESGEMLAGVVLFICGQTVHVQYSAASQKGLQCAAQDFLYLSLVRHYAETETMRYFDFGTSNEEHGRVLNATLNRYKEGFGARGVTYKQWRIKLL